AKQTVNLASINMTQLRNCPIPLPPMAEQEQIVAEVERRLSVVSELDAALSANLKRAGRLRQSILREAFAGRLVPQDASDEPASVLLERIRAARSGQDASNGHRGKRQKVESHALNRQLWTDVDEI
ncbi:MAG: restriction endonuclease subunit S, partial [Ktedonobacterales bacterium]